MTNGFVPCLSTAAAGHCWCWRRRQWENRVAASIGEEKNPQSLAASLHDLCLPSLVDEL
nr:hypothetical protein Iba_chr05cCG9350 [Ipomoea batatas]GMD00913.1 hypothetical protein Iba_scaffold66414CG0010 [Ipomoea batatas]